MLERNDQARTLEFWKQQQEIERLERQLAKYHGKTGVSANERRSQPVRHEQAWNLEWEKGEISQKIKPTRRRERVSQQEEGKRRGSEEAKERSQWAEWRLKMYGEEEEEKAERRMERGKEDPRWRFKAFDEDEEKESAIRQEIKPKMEGRRAKDEYQYGPPSRSGTSGEHQDLLINMPSSETATTERIGEGRLEMTFAEDISLPRNLEDLLAQWTTLDREEIREQFSMF
jgi:hypothetical protein